VRPNLRTLRALAVLSSWTIGALFFSLGPELGGQLFHTSNAIVAGLSVVALSAASIVAQLLTGRNAPWIATSTGSIALAAGIILVVVAAATGSPTTYLAGSIVAGLGFGAAFLGGLRALVAQIPPQHRASVLSAFYVVAYGALSLPAILAGIAVSYITLQSTFEIFGSIVAEIGLIVAIEAWRTRPTSPTQQTEGNEVHRARKRASHAQKRVMGIRKWRRSNAQSYELSLSFGELALMYKSLQAVKALGALPPQDELLNDTIQLVDQALNGAA
jgi:MFS family permease